MNTATSRGIVRFVAGPVAAASIISGALGLASVANASTTPTSTHDMRAMVQAQNPHEPCSSDTLRNYRDKWSDAQKRVQATNAGGLMQATNAGGLMQATNAGGLMQATGPKA